MNHCDESQYTRKNKKGKCTPVTTMPADCIKIHGKLSSADIYNVHTSWVTCVILGSGVNDNFLTDLQGKLLGEKDTSFGSFVRCGYPRVTSSGDMEIVSDCGRYSR